MVKWYLRQVIRSKYTPIAIFVVVLLNVLILDTLPNRMPIHDYAPEYFYYIYFYMDVINMPYILILIFSMNFIFVIENAFSRDEYEILVNQRFSRSKTVRAKVIAIFIATFVISFLIFYSSHLFVYLLYGGDGLYLIEIPEEFNPDNVLRLVGHPHLLTFYITITISISLALINAIILKLSETFTIKRNIDKYILPLLIVIVPQLVLNGVSLVDMVNYNIYEYRENELYETTIIFVKFVIVMLSIYLIFDKTIPVIERVFYKSTKNSREYIEAIKRKLEEKLHFDEIIRFLPYLTYCLMLIISLNISKNSFRNTGIPNTNSLEVFLNLDAFGIDYSYDFNNSLAIIASSILIFTMLIFMIIRYTITYYDDIIIMYRTRYRSGYKMYLDFYLKIIKYTNFLYLMYLIISLIMFRNYDLSSMFVYYLINYLIFVTIATIIFTIRMVFETKFALFTSLLVVIGYSAYSIEQVQTAGIHTSGKSIHIFSNHMMSYNYKLTYDNLYLKMIVLYLSINVFLLALSYLIYTFKNRRVFRW